MRQWQYETVAYMRNHAQGEPAIVGVSGKMSDIETQACRHLDWFLREAGLKGWELVSTLLPFAPGKEISIEDEVDERVTRTYQLEDALDIQWMIFKREV